MPPPTEPPTPLVEPKTSEVFDNSDTTPLNRGGPLDFSRLRAKPWKNATHGRYKDIFNLQALDRKDGQRPMRMSPDLDFKIDKRDKAEDLVPL